MLPVSYLLFSQMCSLFCVQKYINMKGKGVEHEVLTYFKVVFQHLS